MERRYPRLLPRIFPSLAEAPRQRRAGCPGDPSMDCRIPKWAIGVGGAVGAFWMGNNVYAAVQRDRALHLKAQQVAALEQAVDIETELAMGMLGAESDEERAQRG